MMTRAKHLFFLGLLLFCAENLCETLITVEGIEGQALGNIIVELRAENLEANSQAKQALVIKQIEQQFVPHISLVAIGSQISFPNTDSVQHHVYSFSPAKTFEVSLEEQFTSKPVTFDQAGVVELGCNIHDWMLAYVFVSDAHYFGKTANNGELALDLPNGKFEVSIWHPRLSDEDLNYTAILKVEDVSSTFNIRLKHDLLPILNGYDSAEGVDVY